MNSLSVMLVDPSALSRAGLRSLLIGAGARVLGVVASAEEAKGLLSPDLVRVPDVLLVDVAASKDLPALAACSRVMHPQPRIVVLGPDQEPSRILDALVAGADGYLTKDLSAAALVETLRLVVLGEKVLPASLVCMIADGTCPDLPPVAADTKGLSPRELEILRHVAEGDSNKVIGNRLGISEATVKVHLKSLLRKIGATNRTQAAVWAFDNGLARAEAADRPARSAVAGHGIERLRAAVS
ncbi:LuxR C-terminal-related transcriptional regulator [Arenibaculum pallidiluteum]|uniref:LuxR C-terminal-related transcriptional regulator n=1 Tax=Arenibaculum pallidiluteum TaxID=2812559 RepID=UPI001A958BCB|nr:response regulator transcription factor [Arenibaculum pallidiluteum]